MAKANKAISTNTSTEILDLLFCSESLLVIHLAYWFDFALSVVWYVVTCRCKIFLIFSVRKFATWLFVKRYHQWVAGAKFKIHFYLQC